MRSVTLLATSAVLDPTVTPAGSTAAGASPWTEIPTTDGGNGIDAVISISVARDSGDFTSGVDQLLLELADSTSDTTGVPYFANYNDANGANLVQGAFTQTVKTTRTAAQRVTCARLVRLRYIGAAHNIIALRPCRIEFRA